MAKQLPKLTASSTVFVAALMAAVIVAGILARTPHTTLALTQTSVTRSSSNSVLKSTPAGTIQPTSTLVQSAAKVTSPQPLHTPASLAGVPAQSTALPAAQAPVIGLSIITPTGTSTFKIAYASGADACQILEQARQEGKISALDIDYSTVKSSLRSAYVRQINTFTNGWTFKVNGVSPEGCSLSHPAVNDQIIWRYQ
jgi:hypothetical protein